MRDSTHGWVYLETTMNEDLVRHLRLSPSVVHRHAGVIWEQVDFADWTKVLSQHNNGKLEGQTHWRLTGLVGFCKDDGGDIS